MNISETFSTLPPLLQPEVSSLWQDYQTNASADEIAHLAQAPQIFDSLPKIWACSLFVAKNCVQHPALLNDLIDSGDLLNVPSNYSQPLANLLLEAKDEVSLMQALRLYRRREMLRIAWRDLAGWASLEESLKSLSDLSDAMLDGALTWVYQHLTAQFGTPCDSNGIPQHLVVLALGKLGGQELNFSSDIDLIFSYPEQGETKGVKRPRTNQEFFLRLGQKLIQVLNNITADGFVFRVDMRLRPFGDAGPLAISFSAMEDYYQAHARDWERYAQVKARVAAGDKPAGESLLKTLRPFVYRRYLDFNAFEALRNMKAMIDQETSRKGLNNNIKLGPGGIREIEFVCQVFQLIRGGRQPALQQRHLLTTLAQIEKYQLLPSEVVTRLREAYHFLRLTENHLQAIEDRQTQTLPEDELNQTRLAYSMGFSDWSHFLAQLLQHHQQVHLEFEQVIAPEPTLPKPIESLQSIESNRWQTLWSGGLDNKEEAELLLKADFQNAAEVLAHLQQLLESRTVKKLTQRGRQRLDTLIPLVITAAIEQRSPDDAIHRTLKFIESVAQRGVYLALLIERPVVLKQLVRLCADSAWIAEQLTRYPLLLDELIDPRRLYDPLKPDELDNALQAQLAHLPKEDLDMQMDSLRQFKRSQVLHVAAAELSGNMSAPDASDYLAAIADTLVRHALVMARDYLTPKYGQPRCNDQGDNRPAELAIIAYGKAGGIELSYGSDLDIVFLHDSCGTAAFTDGDKQLDNQVFFARLAQRIIHILTINTPAGILYEVDSRLRPGGASGMLVSSFDAFTSYQEQNAWTWEHQALVRARIIAGNPDSQARFEKIRRDILSQRRDPDTLKQDVCEMRDKMRVNLDKSKPTKPPFTDDGIFDLKQGHGGIANIEFIIQYAVLRGAADYPNLLDTTGMLPLLHLFAKHGLLEETACRQLGDAFRTYRAETHRLALQNQPAQVDNNKFAEQRQQVMHWWKEIIE
ncbi:MAG: bifunctional [glutamate--ammonia ligase]-adenylyl-L-tyrosine phosphorylase/[glutamate--ammonia-ligase] adenylyltransferase [Candidatus Parabeggiatoa sp. nov. 2]|nr:MAG: bifunctional glutamine synthetase adenylyltransferase/deadenyltransferase [Beggiatoa sp. 4572_84]RKZ64353.1 MAG: bifunctional [glutamate--ammonia ligase]-adenylyl-L-tyrosine phosphorylase/[glutamate--ammonia-ligase] adenylyltransferase [Gammaproteobacteria bacterium]HEC83672.1 bifunctional [glutamate--ammonia ligase]-adenylyl-L-tyrosine phosphorylase/[glutamate--ammonia-ligase] adenylyltransferase [Thioploca sp.]